MENINGRLKRIVKQAIDSGDVEIICDFIVAQSLEEKTRSKLIIAALVELKLRGLVERMGRDLVEKLDVKYKNLPNDFCGEIIKEFSRDRYWDFALIRKAADITAERLLKPNDTILSAACEWLRSDYSETLLESITKKNGRKAMEILIEKTPRIICYLLHRTGEPRTNTLNLLKKVAKHAAKHGERPMEISEIIFDIFEDCAHSEGWTKIANQILEIANILTPVDEPKEDTRVDTTYLINWCKQKNLFSNPVSMDIQDLVGEFGKSITCSSTFQCFNELLQLNRVVDLLMLLDQGIKRYRGHDIHQFNVAALGLFFLDTHIKDGRSLEKYLSDFYKEQFDEPFDIKNTWLLASLLHDHALPIYHMFAIAPHVCQRIWDRVRIAKDGSTTHDSYLEALRSDSYLRALRGFRNALERAYNDLFSTDLSRVYRRFRTDAKNKEEVLKNLVSKEMFKIGLSEFKKNRIDHGVMGAVNVANRSESFLDKKVEVVARAIGIHAMKEELISFKKDPMAFLLVLCDELQEWGREVAVFPDILIDIPSIEIKGFRIEDGNRFFTDSLTISFRVLKDTEQTRFNPIYFIEEKQKFFERRLKFDAPDVFPSINFDEKPTESKLSCKEDIENEWAWSG